MKELYRAIDIFYKHAKETHDKKASGILFICPEDNTILLLKRSDLVGQPGTWNIAGGIVEYDNEAEIPYLKSAYREVVEELGSLPHNMSKLAFTDFMDDSFTYRTFVVSIPLKSKQNWNIHLNWESDNAKWFKINKLPNNLHYGVEYTLSQFI